MGSPYAFNMNSPYGGYGGSSPYQQPQTSPFIPPANLLSSASPYTSPYGSPYTGPNPLPGGSPNMQNPPLPGAPNTPLHSYAPPYYPWPEPRQRRPSYHGPNPYDAWGSNPPVRQRTHSFGEPAYVMPNLGYGAYGQPPASPFAGSTYPHHGYQLHPFLNGDSPRGDFMFDLSAPKFVPLRYVGPGQTEALPTEELQQPATWPAITQLRIVCDDIPHWPLDIQFDPAYFGGAGPPPGFQMPPITIGDILVKLYEHLAQRITHMDWVGLSPEQETAVGRAYTLRCKALGSAEAVERSQGVKRIDFCLGKVWFRGLTRTTEGMNVLKLHLHKR